jgi:hypothetical protein
MRQMLFGWALLLTLFSGAVAFGDRVGSGEPHPMGRLRTVGFEAVIGTAASGLDGSTNGAVTLDTTVVRSGVSSAKFDGAAGAIANLGLTPGSSPAEMYARVYFYITDRPTSTVPILQFFNATAQVSVRLESGGGLELFNTAGSVQIGATSAALNTGQWYRIEVHVRMDAAVAANRTAELQIDGVSIASGLHTSAFSNISGITVGWGANPGVSKILNADDFAWNDTSGATQNSWPGEGRIVLLKPISDNAKGGWTGGAGGTSNLFDAVNNLPPVGVAVASETNTSQIKNLVSSITDNYDANMTDYTTAGITATDTITLVQAFCDTGEGIATGTKAGALQIVSNPAQAVEDSFNYGNDLGAAGTWSTNWFVTNGTAQVGDITAANRSTSPVLRVGKRTATTREVNVDLMGIYVEYTQGLPVSALHPFMDGPATNTLLRM